MAFSKICLRFSFLLVFAAGSLHGQAQMTSSTGKPPVKLLIKKPKPLTRELSVGVRLNTDGFSIYADKGYVRSEETKLYDYLYNLRIVSVEFGEHKDPRQIKKKYESGNGDQTKAFVYGKINNFYSFKLGYGFRRMIAGKPEPGTVSIHWIGNAGIAIGLEKPYYIEAYAPQDNSASLVQQSIKYTDKTQEYFLNDYYIIGGSGFGKGLDELKVVPGVHVKTGLHFDFAADKHNVLALETGINAEFYSRKIQLMARQEGVPYFVSLFASLQFGKRW